MVQQIPRWFGPLDLVGTNSCSCISSFWCRILLHDVVKPSRIMLHTLSICCQWNLPLTVVAALPTIDGLLVYGPQQTIILALQCLWYWKLHLFWYPLYNNIPLVIYTQWYFYTLFRYSGYICKHNTLFITIIYQIFYVYLLT